MEHLKKCFSFVLTLQDCLKQSCTWHFSNMTNLERHQKRYERRKYFRELKRVTKNASYDNYDILLNPENILFSYLKCRKGVSWKYSTQYYGLHLLENIYKTEESLAEIRLPSKGFTCFNINERGKTRHIRSPHISERIVQKVLCEKILEPILMRTLIYDNGASIKGKGTNFTKKRLIKHLTKYRKQHGVIGYALLIDFKKYFDSINHIKLKELLAKYIKDIRVYDLCCQAIDEFGTIGLGIGSQISQILSVFYPNSIDHFFKEQRREKFYGRYMDDTYIISTSKEHLQENLVYLKDLCNSLGISLNMKKTKIVKLNMGVSFLHCNYIYSQHGKILKLGGRESAKRVRHKLHYFQKEWLCGRMQLKTIQTWYKSWRGYMLTFDSKLQLYNTDKLYIFLFGGK